MQNINKIIMLVAFLVNSIALFSPVLYNNFGDLMGTTVYIIRHCEAEGNRTASFQGHVDSDITDIGSHQLKFLAERFKDIHIDKVFSSPLLRAKSTADAVADIKGLTTYTDNDLIEIYGGEIENMTYADIYAKWPYVEVSWVNSPQDFCAPGGESMRKVYERIWHGVKKIIAKNKGKSIVIASHGAAIRCLLCRLIFGDIEKLNSVNWSDNTAVSKLTFDENFNCSIEYLNDASHLPKELLPKKSRITSMIKAD